MRAGCVRCSGCKGWGFPAGRVNSTSVAIGTSRTWAMGRTPGTMRWRTGADTGGSGLGVQAPAV